MIVCYLRPHYIEVPGNFSQVLLIPPQLAGAQLAGAQLAGAQLAGAQLASGPLNCEKMTLLQLVVVFQTLLFLPHDVISMNSNSLSTYHHKSAQIVQT